MSEMVLLPKDENCPPGERKTVVYTSTGKRVFSGQQIHAYTYLKDEVPKAKRQRLKVLNIETDEFVRADVWFENRKWNIVENALDRLIASDRSLLDIAKTVDLIHTYT